MDGAVFVTLNRHHSQFKGDKREGPVLRWDEGGRRLVGLYRTLYHQNVSMLAVCRTYISIYGSMKNCLSNRFNSSKKRTLFSGNCR